MADSDAANGVHAFDFLWGDWDVHNTRLISRLTGSNEWEEFDGRGKCWPILGGAGNVDTLSTRWRDSDFEGASVRVFNRTTGLWAIYWADNASGTLFSPVFGSFVDQAGEFHGDDLDEGRPVRVRFRWSDISPTTARWEQAFSQDGGETWEVNWIMAFSRTAPDENA